MNGDARPAAKETRGGEEADGLDGLRYERDSVHRLGLGVQQRKTGRRRECIARQQSGEREDGGGDREVRLGAAGQRDGECGKENRR